MMKLFEVRRYCYYRVNRPSVFTFLNNKLDVRAVASENCQDICLYDRNLASIFRLFLKRGDKGMYGYMDGKLVAYAWSILNRGKVLTKVRDFFPLPGNAACVHYCRVLDNCQGQKIYQTMLAYLYQDLYQEVDNIYLDTEVTNLPARKAIEKSGGEIQGQLVRVMVLGKTLITLKRSER